MFVTKKSLPRRTFLRGAFGTAIALPFLDAMVPAFAQSRSGTQLRFGAVYIPNGIYPQLWHPTKPGRVTVPGKPGKELAPGTVNSIKHQAGLK